MVSPEKKPRPLGSVTYGQGGWSQCRSNPP